MRHLKVYIWLYWFLNGEISLFQQSKSTQQSATSSKDVIKVVDPSVTELLSGQTGRPAGGDTSLERGTGRNIRT